MGTGLFRAGAPPLDSVSRRHAPRQSTCAPAAPGSTDLVARGVRRRIDAFRPVWPAADGLLGDRVRRGVALYWSRSFPELDHDRRDCLRACTTSGPASGTRRPSRKPTESLDAIPRRPLGARDRGNVARPGALPAARGSARASRAAAAGPPHDRAANATRGARPHAVPPRPPHRWVSHSELLPRCAVVVTTGGATRSRLAPGRRAARRGPDNLGQARQRQPGGQAASESACPPRRCTPERLRAAVEQVSTDPSSRERAADRAALAGAPGAARAAELLQALAASAGERRPLAGGTGRVSRRVAVIGLDCAEP